MSAVLIIKSMYVTILQQVLNTSVLSESVSLKAVSELSLAFSVFIGGIDLKNPFSTDPELPS